MDVPQPKDSAPESPQLDPFMVNVNFLKQQWFRRRDSSRDTSETQLLLNKLQNDLKVQKNRVLALEQELREARQNHTQQSTIEARPDDVPTKLAQPTQPSEQVQEEQDKAQTAAAIARLQEQIETLQSALKSQQEAHTAQLQRQEQELESAKAVQQSLQEDLDRAKQEEKRLLSELTKTQKQLVRTEQTLKQKLEAQKDEHKTVKEQLSLAQYDVRRVQKQLQQKDKLLAEYETSAVETKAETSSGHDVHQNENTEEDEMETTSAPLHDDSKKPEVNQDEQQNTMITTVGSHEEDPFAVLDYCEIYGEPDEKRQRVEGFGHDAGL